MSEVIKALQFCDIWLELKIGRMDFNSLGEPQHLVIVEQPISVSTTALNSQINQSQIMELQRLIEGACNEANEKLSSMLKFKKD